jgi:hypothetical protein
LDAVRGSLSADRSSERAAEADPGLVSVEELIGVLLQQTGRAEEPDSCRRDVIGRELERSEHSAAIEERPSDVSNAFDPHSVGEASKMGCRRLIQRPYEVGSLIRDREARPGVPNNLEELLFLRLGVLRNGREGLLDPLRNRSQVGFGHGFEEGWAVIHQQAEVVTSQGRDRRSASAALGALRLGSTARLRLRSRLRRRRRLRLGG